MRAYAKSGISFQAGSGFVFTGISDGDDWEIDKPTDGSFIHGITKEYTDEDTPRNVFVTGAGPAYVSITEDVSVGDSLTASTNGSFRIKGMSDTLVGVALTDGIMNDVCAALLIFLG